MTAFRSLPFSNFDRLPLRQILRTKLHHKSPVTWPFQRSYHSKRAKMFNLPSKWGILILIVSSFWEIPYFRLQHKEKQWGSLKVPDSPLFVLSVKFRQLIDFHMPPILVVLILFSRFIDLPDDLLPFPSVLKKGQTFNPINRQS